MGLSMTARQGNFCTLYILGSISLESVLPCKLYLQSFLTLTAKVDLAHLRESPLALLCARNALAHDIAVAEPDRPRSVTTFHACLCHLSIRQLQIDP